MMDHRLWPGSESGDLWTELTFSERDAPNFGATRTVRFRR